VTRAARRSGVRNAAIALSATLLLTACPAPRPTDDGPPGIAIPTPTDAGATPGAASVTDNGTARYEIKLWTPPARRGIGPDLVLRYDSQAHNGIAGVGWTLDGVPAITRCRKTYARDGFPAGVTFVDATDGDRYCLDGRRLTLAANSTAPYGAAGSEYRTEPDTHVKVVLQQADAQGPVEFAVYQQSGAIAFLGGAGATVAGERMSVATAQQSDPLGHLTTSWTTTRGPVVRYGWSLDRMTDRTGNAMQATYKTMEADGGYHLRLESLRYTSHASGLPADRGVTFVYEDRPDHERRWVAGLLLIQDQRLKRVDTWLRSPTTSHRPGTRLGKPVTIQSYELGYDQSRTTGLSLLRYLRECAPDNGATRCLPATQFSYSRAGGFELPPSSPSQPAPTGSLGPRSNRGALDLDGDGGDELVGEPRPTQPNTGSLDLLWQPPLDAEFTGDELPDDAQVKRIPVSGGPGFSSSNGRLFLSKRQRNANGSVSLVDISDGADPPGPTQDSAFFFDVDDDGRPELFRGGSVRFRPNVGVGPLTPTGFAPYQTVQPSLGVGPQDQPYVVDIDGSGAGHLIFGSRAFGGPGLGHRVTTTLGDPPTAHVVTPPPTSAADRPLDVFADVTGDGLADRIQPTDDGTYYVQVNTGKDFLEPALWDVPPNYKEGYLGPAHQSGIRVMDYNLDGRQDLLLMGGIKSFSGPGTPSRYLVALVSTGSGFDAQRVPGEFVDSDSGVAAAGVLDANGDGLPEFADYRGPHRRQGMAPDLLVAVIDGLGGGTALGYKPLVDGTVHTRATGCAYPVRCVTRGPWVVSALTIDSSGPHPRTFTYHYDGGRSDLTGLGWLGFDKRTVTDGATGTVTTYAFDNTKRVDVVVNGVRTQSYHPFAQQVKSSTTVVPVSATRKIETRSDTTFVEAKGADGTWFVHPVKVESRERQIDGATSRLIGSRAVEQTVDAYGNVVTATITVDRIGANGTVNGTWRTNRSVAVVNLASSWLIGLLDREEVTSTNPSGTSATRVTEYDADTATGLVGTIRVEPGAIGIDETGKSGTGLTVVRNYDAFGQLHDETTTGSGHTHTQTAEWDPVDHVNPVVLRDALGHETKLSLDRRRGIVTEQADANGVKTTSAYDPFGRLAKSSSADGSSVEVSHAMQGDLVATTMKPSSGPPYVVLRDRLGREVGRRWTAPNGVAVGIDTTYDAAGRMASRTRPVLASDLPATTARQSFAYDPFGRMVKTTNADGTSATWEYDGLLTTSRDEQGDQELRTSNELGLPATVGEVLSPGKVLTTSYEYGPFGSLTKTTGPDGATSTMAYDVLGRRATINDPDTGLETDRYDAFGDVKEAVDARGASVRYERDDLGRLVKATSNDGVSSFEWDTAANGKGALAKATSPSGVVTEYAYDSVGRPRETAWVVGGERFAVGRAWDTAGRLAKVSYPAVPGRGRFDVDYAYANGALTTVTAGTDTLWQAKAWTPAGDIAEEELGSGAQSTYKYDDVGQLTKITTMRGATMLRSLGYEYEDDGDLRRHVDGVTGTTEAYEHDAVGRLTKDTLTTGAATDVRSWTYRDGGTLATRTDPSASGPVTTTYGVGAGGARPHLVTSATPSGGGSPSPVAAFGYDASGRQTQAPGRSITWTELDLPATITTAAGTATLTYDAEGSRVRRSGPDGVQLTLGDLYGRRTAPAAGGGGGAATVTHLFRVPVGGAIAEVEWSGATSTKTRYLHADRLGSVDLVEDGTASVKLRYDPFGGRRDLTSGRAATGAPPSERLGFTGQPHDDGDGIVDMGGRVYDPGLGRFLSADPLVDDGGQALDRYSYARNRPLTLTDPTGFQAAPPVTYYNFDEDEGEDLSDSNGANAPSPTSPSDNPGGDKDAESGLLGHEDAKTGPTPSEPGSTSSTPASPAGKSDAQDSATPNVAVQGNSQTAAATTGPRTTGWEGILPPTNSLHISNLGRKGSPVYDAVVGAKPLYQAANAVTMVSLGAAGGVIVTEVAGGAAAVGTGLKSAFEAASAAYLDASIKLAVTFPRVATLVLGYLAAETGGEAPVGLLPAGQAAGVVGTALHGNAANSGKHNILYALYAKSGQFLKWGITSNPSPLMRYSLKVRQGVDMRFVASGSRTEMLALERFLVERVPGPANKEAFRGIASGPQADGVQQFLDRFMGYVYGGK
jgi:RHS repeat-associated protein